MCCCCQMQVPAGAARSGQQAGSGCVWGFHPGPVCCLQQAICMVLVHDGRQTCVPVGRSAYHSWGLQTRSGHCRIQLAATSCCKQGAGAAAADQEGSSACLLGCLHRQQPGLLLQPCAAVPGDCCALQDLQTQQVL